MAKLPVVVSGLIHSAQDTLVYKGLLACAPNTVQDLSEILGAGGPLFQLGALYPQPVEQVAELVDPVGVGLLMDTVEEGYLGI